MPYSSAASAAAAAESAQVKAAQGTACKGCRAGLAAVEWRRSNGGGAAVEWRRSSKWRRGVSWRSRNALRCQHARTSTLWPLRLPPAPLSSTAKELFAVVPDSLPWDHTCVQSIVACRRTRKATAPAHAAPPPPTSSGFPRRSPTLLSKSDRPSKAENFLTGGTQRLGAMGGAVLDTTAALVGVAPALRIDEARSWAGLVSETVGTCGRRLWGAPAAAAAAAAGTTRRLPPHPPRRPLSYRMPCGATCLSRCQPFQVAHYRSSSSLTARATPPIWSRQGGM